MQMVRCPANVLLNDASTSPAARALILGCLEYGIRSLGHSVTRSLGHSVTRSLGHSVIAPHFAFYLPSNWPPLVLNPLSHHSLSLLSLALLSLAIFSLARFSLTLLFLAHKRPRRTL